MNVNRVTVNTNENVVEISSVGIQGPRGKGVLHGSGVPSNSLGTDGEFYIDTVLNRMYGPKTNGQWTTSVNLGGTYVHMQGVPSSTWVINHNLEYYPSVEIVNSAGVAVIGDYQYVNANTVIANFTDPFAGKAYLS
jgi:hypothetical protein